MWRNLPSERCGEARLIDKFSFRLFFLLLLVLGALGVCVPLAMALLIYGLSVSKGRGGGGVVGEHVAQPSEREVWRAKRTDFSEPV